MPFSLKDFVFPLSGFQGHRSQHDTYGVTSFGKVRGLASRAGGVSGVG